MDDCPVAVDALVSRRQLTGHWQLQNGRIFQLYLHAFFPTVIVWQLLIPTPFFYSSPESGTLLRWPQGNIYIFLFYAPGPVFCLRLRKVSGEEMNYVFFQWLRLCSWKENDHRKFAEASVYKIELMSAGLWFESAKVKNFNQNYLSDFCCTKRNPPATKNQWFCNLPTSHARSAFVYITVTS